MITFMRRVEQDAVLANENKFTLFASMFGGSVGTKKQLSVILGESLDDEKNNSVASWPVWVVEDKIKQPAIVYHAMNKGNNDIVHVWLAGLDIKDKSSQLEVGSAFLSSISTLCREGA